MRARIGIATILLATAFAAPAVGHAAEPGEAEELRAWHHGLYKAIPYETMASLDAVAFGYLYGGGTVTGGAFALASALAAGGLYYGHELTWNRYGPDPNGADIDTKIWKAVSYRAVSTTRIVASGLLLTGSPLVSVGYAAVSAVIDSAVFVLNDVAWQRWGPPVEYLGR